MDKSKEKKETEKKEEDNDDDLKLEKPSYTYWKRESDKAADHTKFSPQLANPNNKEESNGNKVGSVWNKAGTWEEKKINKNQIEEFFNTKIKESEIVIKNAFKLSNFSGYTGDVK